MTRTREDRVTEYMEDWHGGFWDLRTTDRDASVRRLAEDVVAWFDIDIRVARFYARTAEDMLEAGTLKLYPLEGGTLVFELPDREQAGSVHGTNL